MKWFWMSVLVLAVAALVFTLAPTKRGVATAESNSDSTVTATSARESVRKQSGPPHAPSDTSVTTDRESPGAPSKEIVAATASNPPAVAPSTSNPSKHTSAPVAAEPVTATSQPATAAAPPATTASTTPATTVAAPKETSKAPAAEPKAELAGSSTSATSPKAAEPRAISEQQAAQADGARAMSDALDAALAGNDAPTSSAGASAGHRSSASGAATSSPSGAQAASASAAAAANGDASTAAKLTPQSDGSVLVDDKYVLKGAGTKESPYRVTWDQLTSAEQTYQPRLGRKVVPDRVKMLSGKWVTISGYVAFPIMAQSQDEMLMMLNQWDGCCIGVPPTPYDAIEVKLKAAAKGDERMRVTGEITGVLKVDPYLVKDWLVSLYLMDDAVLK